MKPFCLREILISLLVILAAFGAGTSASVFADADVPLDASMRMTTKTVMQGEPIVLHYSLTNFGDQKIGTHFGIYNDDWYTLSLVDQTGHPIRPLPDLRPVRPTSPAYRTPNPFLPPGQTRTGDIVLSRFFAISHPGKYILSVDVHLPTVEVSMEEENPSHVEEMLRTSSTEFRNTYRFSFVVIIADPAKLQATAEGLRQAAVQNRTKGDLSLSVDQLLSMPVATALPNWLALVTGANGRPDLVVKSLSDFPSPRAADILANMAWDTNWQQSKYPADRILTALREMRETPDGSLRQHIDALFANHGIKATDVPQAVD